MQYMKELPNGNRVAVTQQQFNIDRHLPGYQQIIARGELMIYRMTGPGSRPKETRYVYGGTKRLGQFFDNGKANHNPGRVLSRERGQGINRGT